MTDPSDAERRREEAAQRVYDEQESNARATGDGGPRDDAQADEWAAEAERESAAENEGMAAAPDERPADEAI
jgi:hypothetical protein